MNSDCLSAKPHVQRTPAWRGPMTAPCIPPKSLPKSLRPSDVRQHHHRTGSPLFVSVGQLAVWRALAGAQGFPAMVSPGVCPSRSPLPLLESFAKHSLGHPAALRSIIKPASESHRANLARLEMPRGWGQESPPAFSVSRLRGTCRSCETKVPFGRLLAALYQRHQVAAQPGVLVSWQGTWAGER